MGVGGYDKVITGSTLLVSPLFKTTKIPSYHLFQDNKRGNIPGRKAFPRAA